METTSGIHPRGIPVFELEPEYDDLGFRQPVADLEYAIRTHEFFKRWFRRALIVHIVLSLIFYLLLVLHIWAGIHFGLRWLT